MKRNLRNVFALGLAGLMSYTARPDFIINEIVSDPQTDHDGNGTVTNTDEFVELYNNGDSAIDLTGYRIELIDTTPDAQSLAGLVQAGEYLLLQNPPGNLNNDCRVEVYNGNNELVNSWTLGSWDDGNVEDNFPSGNAQSASDESTSLYENSIIKTYATPGYSNVPEPTTFALVGGLAALVSARRKR